MDIKVAEVLRRIHAARENAADPARGVLAAPGFALAHEGMVAAASMDERGNVVGKLDGRAKVTFHPRSTGNTVLLGAHQMARVSVSVMGNDNLVIIGASRKLNAAIHVLGSRSMAWISDRSTCNSGGSFVLSGSDVSIILGEDCMLSMGVTIRSADNHAIIDLESKEIINAPQSVVLHRHVWCGERAIVLKGTTVGTGSIVAAGAIATTDIPECSIAVGTPARVLKSGVSWTRRPLPEMAERERLRALVLEEAMVEA